MTDFRVCLGKDHAQQLLKFALTSLIPRNFWGNFASNARLQTVRATSFEAHAPCITIYNHKHQHLQQQQHVQFVNSLDNFKSGLDVVGFCIVIDLCRPYRYLIHRLLIADSFIADQRSYSNSPDESNFTSRLFEHGDKRVWCPNIQSEQMDGAPDFVELQTPQPQECCIEGVAVNASSHVGIRVEMDYLERISTGYWEHRAWVPVAGGALLRPTKYTEDLSAVQLIPFPEPYFGIRLQGVRITMLECDGKAVRVGLIISELEEADFEKKKKKLRTATAESLCGTENFDDANDYRAWWYRLQAGREGVQRTVSSLCDLQYKAHRELGILRSKSKALDKANVDISVQCFEEDDPSGIVVYYIVYGSLLLVAFPIMLAMNLDQLEANMTNTSNTSNVTSPTNPRYTMARSNPERILRTICWQSSSDPPRVPWLAVLCPFLLAAAFAVSMISVHVRGVFKRFIQTKGIVDDLRVSNRTLKHVHAEINDHFQAIDQVSEDVKIKAVVKAANKEYMMIDSFYFEPPARKKLYLQDSQMLPVSLDILVLIICVFAAVVCAVPEWWCRLGSEENVALPIIYVGLCVVADVVMVVFLRRCSTGVETIRDMCFGCCSERLGEDFYIKPVHRAYLTMLVTSTVLLQQLLLLLEMFAFFNQVSFFFVFSPFFIVAVSMCPCCAYGVEIWFVTICLVLMSPSVVLLMLKADKLLGIGTALLLGPAFPEFSWFMVMVPIWVNFTFLFPVLMCMLAKAYEAMDD